MQWPDMRRWYVMSYDLKKGTVNLCRNNPVKHKALKINEPVLALMRAEYIRGQQEAREQIQIALGIKKEKDNVSA